MPATFKKASRDQMQGPRVLYWFRTDLRLHDSPALTHALSLNPSALMPLWTWDPHYVYRQRGAANRWRFLVECMGDLSQSLTELNDKQKLFVVRGSAGPPKTIGMLLRKWKIDVLVFEKDTDAYARMRDGEVSKVARDLGVQVVSVSGRTLFDSEEVVKMNGGKPTMSMAQLVKAVAKIGQGVPAKPLGRPTSFPDPLNEREMDLSDQDHELLGDGQRRDQTSLLGWPGVADMDYNAIQRTLGPEKDTQYASGLMGPGRDFSIPTLEEMGIDPSSVTTPHQGGETAGLALLAGHVADEEYISTFEKPATAPTAFEPPATTLLSPHMHFGTVSCRKFWWDVQAVLEKRRKEKKRVSDQPVNIPGQLLFRDMYFAAHAQVGVPFGQTVGNPVARFIPWHLQSRYFVGDDGKPVTDGSYVVDDAQAEEYFQRWKHGRTGFPWIDALMRQLKQEGWIHHLGRHAVACFLTRGGCYVSWERGAEVFEEWLVDHEVACNAGNWMWLSCTAFFSQFFRCYSPVSFPKKWDPDGLFVKRYIPELDMFDKKYIYEPHKAPIADQKRWGCLVKGDGRSAAGTEQDGKRKYNLYPKPMFDFNERRQFCLDRMKQAYDVGLFGDDQRVINGEWKKLFGFNDAGGALKEEANGGIGSGDKRARDDDGADRRHGDDIREDAGVNDESQDGHRLGTRRKAVKRETRKEDKQQRTLDATLTRKKM
ncbi:cryptochrome [Cladophialophora psammophila CBS 110553]|uniref:Cryptochrome n=1 Tax=Cladophialophora psammophila CBS 110553 TaxID=1182543 RepID=W9XIH7_9EURO|nr:cryptochrome [Cladophialophora psammophila CBS 110553]EXJ70164.1 cryptochrome [Cladophialophora psammophila CBS 110553]